MTQRATIDWAVYQRRSSFGGSIEDVSKPHVRYFSSTNPLKPKREVKIAIYRYWGIGQHYYVSIKETGNPIWDVSRDFWTYPTDDPQGDGKQFTKRVNTVSEAKMFVREMLRKHFPLKTHKPTHDWDNLLDAERKVWFGRFKEGD